MASSTLLAILAIVLIAPTLAKHLCDEVECGEEKCKADGSFPLGWVCEFDSDWKRTHDDDDADDDADDDDDDDDDDDQFLPCVIPDC